MQGSSRASIATALLKLAQPVLRDVAISRCAKIIRVRKARKDLVLCYLSRAAQVRPLLGSSSASYFMTLIKCVAHLQGYLLLSQQESGGKSHG